MTTLHPLLERAVDDLLRQVAPEGKIDADLLDRRQVQAFDLALLAGWAYAAECAPEVESLAHQEACVLLGLEPSEMPPLEDVGRHFLAGKSPFHTPLDDEHRMIRDTFRRFAEESVVPIAERIHRNDELIPEEIIRGLAELGCFGLSIPPDYGGCRDPLAMLIATEELSRGSLGAAGSLITRAEIFARAILKGATEEQKQHWLPVVAAGEKMVSVAVTEPDAGSDVGALRTTATLKDDGWHLRGTKTWCTFAGWAEWMLVLARTGPEPRHKGLTLFVVEKPAFPGHSFDLGTVKGRAIDTIGYRGMHSFEVVFEDHIVPDDNRIGAIGQGFALQMEGFAGGRVQTAARAVGVMQAAFEKAVRYANERKAFGKFLAGYPLTQHRIGKMALLIHASRQSAWRARTQTECALVKLFAARAAEWVTREAQQLHGGMGYAEEYDVSRYFVDARVFSLFEGAEEVLALRVIAKELLHERLRDRQAAVVR